MIGVAPFEALYVLKCRSPICWHEVGEQKLIGPQLLQRTVEKVNIIRSKMKTTQSRQKSEPNIEEGFKIGKGSCFVC